MVDEYWIEQIFASDFEDEPCEYAIMSGNTSRVCYFNTKREAEAMIDRLRKFVFGSIDEARSYASNIRREIQCH